MLPSFRNFYAALPFVFVTCASLATSRAPATASEATVWDTFKDGFMPVPNTASTLLAIDSGEKAQVWTLTKDGVLGQKVWDSQQLTARAFRSGYCWAGDALLLSKTTHGKSPQQLKALSYEQGQKLVMGRGETWWINPKTGQSHLLLHAAYYHLVVDKSGKFLTAFNPTHGDGDIKTTRVDFYRLDANQGAQFLGHCNAPITEVVGWSPDTKSVYALSINGYTRDDPHYRATLLSLTLDGHSTDLLPSTAVLVTTNLQGSPSEGHPAITFDQEGRVSAFIEYLQQSDSMAIIGPHGIEKAFKYSAIKDLMGGIPDFQIIGMIPNSRFLLVADVSLYSKDNSLNALWVVDLASKKRRKLDAHLPPIKGIFGWAGDHLFVAFTKESPTSSFGVVRVEEAALAASNPRLVALLGSPAWQDAKPLQAPLSASEKAIFAFLQQGDLVPSKVSTLKKVGFGQPATEETPVIYGLDRQDLNQGFTVFDPTKNRVTAFQAPAAMPPLPDQPISAQKAQGVAEQFARAQKPQLFAAGDNVKADLEPRINERANYLVRFYPLAEGAEPGATDVWVEVRASDGKIAGYYEQPALSPQVRLPRDVADPSKGALIDQDPRVSLDGKQVAFLSNRPRPGYPLWWPGRRKGLFLINADGTNFRLVAPYVNTAPIWSPDGRHLAFRTDTKICVYDVTTQKLQDVPQVKDELIEQNLFGWLNKDDLLLGWVHNGPGGCDLVSWKPVQPQQAPVVLVKDWSNQVGNDWGAGAFALSNDGTTLFFTWRLLNDAIGVASHGLYAVPVNQLTAKPRTVAARLPGGDTVQWLPQGILVTGSDHALLVNPLTGQVADWHTPLPLQPSVRGDGTSATIMRSTADGRFLVFTGLLQGEHPDEPKSALLNMAHVDGTNIKPLTQSSPMPKSSLTHK